MRSIVLFALSAVLSLTMLSYAEPSWAKFDRIEAKEFEYPYDVKVYDLPVSENGIGYRVYIRPPIGQVAEGEKAATFYFLDALTNFTPAAAMSYNYEYFRYMPAAYFVGIGYQNEADSLPKESNRTRDYTPTEFIPDKDHFLYESKKDWEGSGGAEAFWKVVEKEIIPFVESLHEVDETERVLVGKSTSGLGAVYPAIAMPGLFKRYLVISPAIWWDDWLKPRNERAISLLAEETRDTDYPFKTRIYFAAGDDEERMGMVTDVYSLANQKYYIFHYS